jgi:hypothetical protein
MLNSIFDGQRETLRTNYRTDVAYAFYLVVNVRANGYSNILN